MAQYASAPGLSALCVSTHLIFITTLRLGIVAAVGEEVGVQRDWATMLKVTNVVGGGAGIARVSVVLLGSES